MGNLSSLGRAGADACAAAQRRAPHDAVVAESVVAIVTRAGNPKNVRGWDDLTRRATPPLFQTPSSGLLLDPSCLQHACKLGQ